MSRNIYDVIRRVVMTEKSYAQADESNTYVLEVSKAATKHDVANAVEKLFDVQVLSVRTLVQRGKKKRFGRTFGKRPNFKKAYVTLAKGQSIEVESLG